MKAIKGARDETLIKSDFIHLAIALKSGRESFGSLERSENEPNLIINNQTVPPGPRVALPAWHEKA
jgi:hypothetical protein